MARDVVDDRLIGALHVRTLTRSGFDHDASATHLVIQAGTVAALMDGHYDGDLTLGEVLAPRTTASARSKVSTASS